MSARREAGRRHDAVPVTSEEIGDGAPGRDPRDDPDRPDDLERREDVDHPDLDDLEHLDDDPDDVPEVNAWLTIVMFAFFVVTTVGCYFLLDGWH
ncbi:hypothetical protein [Georgenia sp. Z1491]|uniref:hypothetical protein n=1 Tax=Georgenia sp. Z1491 TaxID=3416707 RepID=UPI003CE90BA8